MKKFIRNKKGFTLIELIVGAIIILASSTAVVTLLFSSFTISNKTNSVEDVRASGNNAINLMQRTIQFAHGFVGVSTDGFVNDNTTSCDTTTEASYAYVRIKTPAGVTQQFSCNAGHLYFDQGAGDVDLIDTNKIQILSCQFTCTQASINSPPVIGINIILASNTQSTSSENNTDITFSTSAKMRNL